MNAKDNRGDTAWIEACLHGKTETAQLIIIQLIIQKISTLT